MTARRPPAATRKPARGARATRKRHGASRRPSVQHRSLRLRRVLAFLLLVSLLVGFIYWLQQKRLAPVEMPPAALSDDSDSVQQAAPPTQKPSSRFEFYEILPQQAVLPSRTPASSGMAKPKPIEQQQPETPRWLQVGTFQDANAAAARLQAIEALGLPGQRQRGFDANGKPLERVVAGPFALASSLARAKDLLEQQGMTATPLKSLDKSQ